MDLDQPEVVKLLLLTDKRVDPNLEDQQHLIRWACCSGHTDLVKLLLTYPLVDPSSAEHICVRYASAHGMTEIVKLLLSHPSVDPSANEQESLCSACQKGHVEIVKLLLADVRVNPSAQEQLPIRLASEYGHFPVVQLLLADSRVDPTMEFQTPIRLASENCWYDVVNLLLCDPRVLPSVNLSIQSLEYSYSIALFALRRSIRLDLMKLRDKDSQWFSSMNCGSIVAEIEEQIESQRQSLLNHHLLPDLSNLCLEYVPDLFCHQLEKVTSLLEAHQLFSFSNLSSL
jgi:hypothetical protein